MTPLRTLALWTAPLAAAALFGVAVERLHAGGAPVGDEERVRSGRFEVLAPAGAAPARVDLPHDWRRTHPRATRARYTFEVRIPAVPETGLDLYLPSTDTSTRVVVNGSVVEAGQPFVTLDSHLWHVPLYAAVPPALWRAGPNEIALEVTPRRAGEAYLAPLHVGPRAALRPAYELRRFLQVTGIQILVVAMVAFALFMGLLWLLRRKEEAALWFAASLLVVAVGFWNLLTIQVWVAKPEWNWVGVAVPGWLLATLTLFAERLAGVRRPAPERALFAAVIAGTAFFAATAGSPAYHALRPAWGACVLAAGVYPAWLTLRRAALEPSAETALLASAALVLFVAATHDVAVANGALPLEHDLAIAWAVVVGVTFAAGVFVRRFIRALDTSEALTAELEQRVAEKRAQLERNYRRLRALEQERAVANERERMVADLHDGLGGQLVSTLAMLRMGDARPAELEAAVQAALDDMRLLIVSMGPEERDLGDALNGLRARLAPRIARAGTAVDWEVASVPTPEGFGPERTLQVLRIVQEAVANVLKHARAGALRVRAGVEDADGRKTVCLTIDDDGCGFRGPGGEGRGLANMRNRAEKIGGTLEIRSNPEGTSVRLALPLEGARAPLAPAGS
jgi:signal transduction histidine kinase